MTNQECSRGRQKTGHPNNLANAAQDCKAGGEVDRYDALETGTAPTSKLVLLPSQAYLQRRWGGPGADHASTPPPAAKAAKTGVWRACKGSKERGVARIHSSLPHPLPLQAALTFTCIAACAAAPRSCMIATARQGAPACQRHRPRVAGAECLIETLSGDVPGFPHSPQQGLVASHCRLRHHPLSQRRHRPPAGSAQHAASSRDKLQAGAPCARLTHHAPGWRPMPWPTEQVWAWREAA